MDKPGKAERNEWVSLMVAIAERDRELYRELRSQAWETVRRSGVRSEKSN